MAIIRQILIFLALICVVPGLNAQEPIMRFGLFADCQSAQKDIGKSRRYTLSPSKLTEAILTFNREGVEFQVSLGDLVDRDIESAEELVPILAKAKKTTYHLLGNHDYLKVDFDRLVEIMSITSPYYYSIKQNGIRLIMLNSNENTMYSTKPGTSEYLKAEQHFAELKAKGASNAEPWNGEVGAEQLKWLEKELVNSQKAGEIVIVMSHHPLVYIANAVTMMNNKQVIKLLQKYSCVKAHFSGHHHMGGYTKMKSIHYVILKGMVETENNRFSIVNVYKDRIELKGYGDEKDRILKFK